MIIRLNIAYLRFSSQKHENTQSVSLQSMFTAVLMMAEVIYTNGIFHFKVLNIEVELNVT